MIAIDPHTGRMVSGVDALTCRFRKLLTTAITSRVKRRAVGNRALSQLGQMQNPNAALIVQNLTLEALSTPANGLQAFKARQCVAKPTSKGFQVTVSGDWKGKTIKLEAAL